MTTVNTELIKAELEEIIRNSAYEHFGIFKESINKTMTQSFGKKKEWDLLNQDQNSKGTDWASLEFKNQRTFAIDLMAQETPTGDLNQKGMIINVSLGNFSDTDERLKFRWRRWKWSHKKNKKGMKAKYRGEELETDLEYVLTTDRGGEIGGLIQTIEYGGVATVYPRSDRRALMIKPGTDGSTKNADMKQHVTKVITPVAPYLNALRDEDAIKNYVGKITKDVVNNFGKK